MTGIRYDDLCLGCITPWDPGHLTPTVGCAGCRKRVHLRCRSRIVVVLDWERVEYAPYYICDDCREID